jgi:hypothetical protein
LVFQEDSEWQKPKAWNAQGYGEREPRATYEKSFWIRILHNISSCQVVPEQPREVAEGFLPAKLHDGPRRHGASQLLLYRGVKGLGDQGRRDIQALPQPLQCRVGLGPGDLDEAGVLRVLGDDGGLEEGEAELDPGVQGRDYVVGEGAPQAVCQLLGVADAVDDGVRVDLVEQRSMERVADEILLLGGEAKPKNWVSRGDPGEEAGVGGEARVVLERTS